MVQVAIAIEYNVYPWLQAYVIVSKVTPVDFETVPNVGATSFGQALGLHIGDEVQVLKMVQVDKALADNA